MEQHPPTNQPRGTVVITGATDGLGRALAIALARETDLRLILHGRSDSRLDDLERALAGSAADITTVRADLAELPQIRQLADRIGGVTDHVSVLINNAGVSPGRLRELTADGHELAFAVNHLAPFALTQHLLPLLSAGPPARIVNVASLSQAPVDFPDLTLTRRYDRARAYSVSKLALITAGMTLAERLDPVAVTVNSLHPGTYMPTKMLDAPELSIDSLDTGVRSTLHLAFAPELAEVTGLFFDRTTPRPAHPDAYRADVRARLWQISGELTR